MTCPRIACLLFALFVTPVPHVGAEPEVKEMDGIWKPVSAELAGKKWPQEILDTIKLTLKDDKYSVQVGDGNDEGTVKRDATKSPKTMDITGTSGPNKGKTFLVIYELKGEELRVCYDLSGKSRPTEFATKPDTQLFLVTYRRAKP
jgi:uncharacterized protein (TIGR03067 family)